MYFFTTVLSIAYCLRAGIALANTGQYVVIPRHSMPGWNQELKDINHIQCLMVCLRNTRCLSVNYNHQDHVCQIQEDDIDTVNIIPNSSYDYMQKSLLRDCTGIRDNDKSAASGDYMVDPRDGGDAFRVYCDMDTDGGGWTVFQRRLDGSVDFYRDWSEYKSGFGNVNSEHWLGNDIIHRLSSADNYELRVDMSSFENESRYAVYDNFQISDETGNYKLILGTYSGTAGDSLGGHRTFQFSTFDIDNDTYGTSCAVIFKGAWWYSACHSSNLNGLYLRGVTTQYATGVVWNTWKGHYYSMKTTEMKMRRL